MDSTMHKIQSINYVTWEKDRSGSEYGVHTGHYFDDNYEAAKQDFAVRSGLVSKDMLFSETELVAVYAGLVKLDSIDENENDADAKIYQSIKNKISFIEEYLLNKYDWKQESSVIYKIKESNNCYVLIDLWLVYGHCKLTK